MPSQHKTKQPNTSPLTHPWTLYHCSLPASPHRAAYRKNNPSQLPSLPDTIGNMPVTHGIQHARCKVPIEYKEEIEKTLQEMLHLQVINPVTQLTEWVSSLTHPHKPGDTLCICLDPCTLDKIII